MSKAELKKLLKSGKKITWEPAPRIHRDYVRILADDVHVGIVKLEVAEEFNIQGWGDETDKQEAKS